MLFATGTTGATDSAVRLTLFVRVREQGVPCQLVRRGCGSDTDKDRHIATVRLPRATTGCDLVVYNWTHELTYVCVYNDRGTAVAQHLPLDAHRHRTVGLPPPPLHRADWWTVRWTPVVCGRSEGSCDNAPTRCAAVSECCFEVLHTDAERGEEETDGVVRAESGRREEEDDDDDECMFRRAHQQYQAMRRVDWGRMRLTTDFTKFI